MALRMVGQKNLEALWSSMYLDSSNYGQLLLTSETYHLAIQVSWPTCSPWSFVWKTKTYVYFLNKTWHFKVNRS